jgi:multicomponent Na+:H+ antiporter subunit E
MSTRFGTRARRIRPFTLVPLALVWVLLWGTWSLGNVVIGLVVALAAVMLLPLPVVSINGRFRLIKLAPVFLRFLVDLVIASVQIAWQAIRPGTQAVSSIVGVTLRSESELILTMVAELISLMPGSLAIELDPRSRTIYAHVLSAPTDTHVAEFKAEVLRLEARLIRAVGSPHEVAALEQERGDLA